jgi:SPP1 family predicted phage head-tail adaptor
MTNPGDLNRRLVLETPNESEDGAGGVTRGFAAVTTLWAQVTPAAMRGEVSADSLGAALRYRIVVRLRADVTTRHRFTEGARVYRILTVRESADRRFLEIDAEVPGD